MAMNPTPIQIDAADRRSQSNNTNGRSRNGWVVASGISLFVAGALLARVYRIRRPAWRLDAQRMLAEQQLNQKANDPTPTLHTWIVTGASSGIGMGVALSLVRAGWSVIIAVRDVEAGRRTKRWIEETCRLPSTPDNEADDEFDPRRRITVLPLVVGELSSVVAFVTRLERWQRESGIQFAGLVNNAGVLAPPDSPRTFDEGDKDDNGGTGWERTMHTNYLGLVQLTEHMIPLLHSSALSTSRRTRIVNIGSRLEGTITQFHLTDPFLNDSSHSSPFEIYAWSKRCVMLWSYGCSRRFIQEKRPIDIVCVTPGMVSTNLFKGGSIWHRIGLSLYSTFFARPISLASEAVLHGCIVPIEDPSKMMYVGECQQVEPSEGAQIVSDQEELVAWTQLELERDRLRRRKRFKQIRQQLESCRNEQDTKPITYDSENASNTIRVFRTPIGFASSPSTAPHHAFLTYRGVTFPCAIGRRGMIAASDKCEGDGCTPASERPLRVRGGFIRSDRINNHTQVGDEKDQLPIWSVTPDQIWHDGATQEGYNTFDSLLMDHARPPLSFEWLHRGVSHVYDRCYILGWNDTPPIRVGGGSAIFLHIATQPPETTPMTSTDGDGMIDYQIIAQSNRLEPTAGCVAILDKHMDMLAKMIDRNTIVRIAEREEDTETTISAASTSSASASSTVGTPKLFQTHFAESTSARPTDGSSLPPGIQFAGAADRNRDVIRRTLEPFLFAHDSKRVLELSSGTGQHAAHFGRSWQERIIIQPSDQNQEGFQSIAYHSRDLPNVLPPICIDLIDQATWANIEPHSFDTLYVANMLHISSPGTSLGLFEVARLALDEVRGRVFIYGPFKWNHQPTTESNRAFDEKLKNMDPSYGLRDVSVIRDVGRDCGFALDEILDMPSANFMLIFRRGEDDLQQGRKITYTRNDGTILQLEAQNTIYP